MTDRELLEKAAKAAGLRIEYWPRPDYLVVNDGLGRKYGWNPLEFDSDAFRLAVKLRMQIHCFDDGAEAADSEEKFSWCISKIGDPGVRSVADATRRAIVRAAAQMAEGASGE